MSTERIKGCVSYSCDLPGCAEALETDEKDFSEAVGTAKEAGWLFRKRGGDWKHFCCEAHEDMDFRGQQIAHR